jgi:hypothetical protein
MQQRKDIVIQPTLWCAAHPDAAHLPHTARLSAVLTVLLLPAAKRASNAHHHSLPHTLIKIMHSLAACR